MFATVMAAIMPTLTESLALERSRFAANPYPSAKDRIAVLSLLIERLLARQNDIAAALDSDFCGRSRMEVMYSEVLVSLSALRDARNHVKLWMKQRDVPLNWPMQPASAWVLPQPIGVVGVVSPWNYPLFLTMGPLAGIIAAGNRVMLKPSETTPAFSRLLSELLDGIGTVIEGDGEVAKQFTALPFDHLLFTGSTETGRAVMRAAAENLTPVTLELGGKSPVLIAADANLRRAAGAIIYGKLLNSGQTCVAPDYILVPRASLDEFAKLLLKEADRQYPGGDGSTAIVNERQFNRLWSMLEQVRASGTRVLGGERREGRRIGPAIIIDPAPNAAVMQQEIFGPLLPLVPYDDIGEAISYINQRPRPLALYLFTANSKLIARVLRQTISGGVCINDTILQIVAEGLPFGGIGPSGMGFYHGRAGFDTFSKLKPVFRRRGIGLNRLLFPPYGRIHQLLKKILID